MVSIGHECGTMGFRDHIFSHSNFSIKLVVVLLDITRVLDTVEQLIYFLNIPSLFNQILSIMNYKSNKMRCHWSNNHTINLSVQKYMVFVKVYGTHLLQMHLKLRILN